MLRPLSRECNRNHFDKGGVEMEISFSRLIIGLLVNSMILAGGGILVRTQGILS